MNKEYVLVSQGIEIYRTQSQEIAINMIKKMNDEYFDYKQKCIDNYETPADNYVELYIEDEYEKNLQHQLEEKDKIIDEAIEFIDNYKAYENVYKQVKPHQFVSGFEDILDEENINKLLEILESGKNGK